MEKFVLHVPKWKGELVFSEELLLFLGVIFLLVVGVLFCFWGYKYFRTILFMGIGAVVCYFSFLLVEPMTKNLAVRMFLTVALTFFGVCFLYLFDLIFCYILDKLWIRRALGKYTYLLAAPAGAAILGLTIYCFVWRDEFTVGLFSVVCLVIGLIYQHMRRKKQVRFQSYDDLLKLKRPETDEDGLEILTLAPVAAAAASAGVAMPEPPAEPEAIAEPELPAEPEAIAEPELPAEPEAIAEPELPAEPEAVAEPEPPAESEAVAEPELPAEPEAVAEPELPAEPEAVAEPELPAEHETLTEPEPEPEVLAGTVELSDEIKRLILQRAEASREQEKDVEVTVKIKAAKPVEATIQITPTNSAKPAVKIKPVSDPSSDSKKSGKAPKAKRKAGAKQGKELAKKAVVAAAGLGLFMAGRASKGRD